MWMPASRLVAVCEAEPSGRPVVVMVVSTASAVMRPLSRLRCAVRAHDFRVGVVPESVFATVASVLVSIAPTSASPATLAAAVLFLEVLDDAPPVTDDCAVRSDWIMPSATLM